jgi:hypothetical protein
MGCVVKECIFHNTTCIVSSMKVGVAYDILINPHYLELMKSMDSHGSSSLVFMMVVMVRHVVRDSHYVMITLIIIPPNCCCEK